MIASACIALIDAKSERFKDKDAPTSGCHSVVAQLLPFFFLRQACKAYDREGFLRPLGRIRSIPAIPDWRWGRVKMAPAHLATAMGGPPQKATPAPRKQEPPYQQTGFSSCAHAFSRRIRTSRPPSTPGRGGASRCYQYESVENKHLGTVALVSHVVGRRAQNRVMTEGSTHCARNRKRIAFWTNCCGRVERTSRCNKDYRTGVRSQTGRAGGW